jgi:hypothetical protein
MQTVYTISSRNVFGDTFLEGIFKTRQKAEEYMGNAPAWIIDNKGNTVIWRLGETDFILNIREVIE